MPNKELDPEDPMELVGVELAVGSEENLHEMALTFAEEFIRGGLGEEEVLALFQNPFYQGPHLVWKAKGREYVRQAIQEAARLWRPLRAIRLADSEGEGREEA